MIVTSGLVAVGITVGKPDCHVGYPLVFLREAAPMGLKEVADEGEFCERYTERLDRERLDRIGVETFLPRAGAWDGPRF